MRGNIFFDITDLNRLIQKEIEMLRKGKSVLAVMLLVALYSSVAMAAAFAPWVSDYNRSHPMAAMVAMSKSDSPLPGREKIGIPAFPGAQVVVHMGKNSQLYKQMIGNDSKTLPALTMVSDKSVDEVVSFYKRHAPGYQYVNSMAGKMFIKTGNKINPRDLSFIKLLMTTPHISISPVPGNGPKLVKWGKSMIEISYRP
jgi:hypothetical protein